MAGERHFINTGDGHGHEVRTDHNAPVHPHPKHGARAVKKDEKLTKPAAKVEKPAEGQ